MPPPSGAWRSPLPAAMNEARIRCTWLRAAYKTLKGVRGSRARSSSHHLHSSDRLVREENDAVIEAPGIDEPHWLLVARLAEEALALAEHDREDLQPQLVDELVLDQRPQELEAAGD